VKKSAMRNSKLNSFILRHILASLSLPHTGIMQLMHLIAQNIISAN